MFSAEVQLVRATRLGNVVPKGCFSWAWALEVMFFPQTLSSCILNSCQLGSTLARHLLAVIPNVQPSTPTGGKEKWDAWFTKDNNGMCPFGPAVAYAEILQLIIVDCQIQSNLKSFSMASNKQIFPKVYKDRKSVV